MKAYGVIGVAGCAPVDFGNAFAAVEEESPPSRTPEQRLLLFTLSRAYSDIFGGEHQAQNEYFKPDPEHRRDAIKWVLSDDRHPFSFLWICDHLSISSVRIRALRRLVCRSSSFGNA